MSEQIKKLLKTDKAVIGTDESLRLLKEGKIRKVYVTSNCPPKVREDVNYYASLSGAAVEDLPIPNDELGVICKKQFRISVLSERQ